VFWLLIMIKKSKKLYLVKREIWAEDIQQAALKHGEIYEIQLAEGYLQDQDEVKNKKIGFNKNNKNA